MVRLLPRRRVEAMVRADGLEGWARALPPDTDVSGLPGRASVTTAGHSPGHGAFQRPEDGVLITCDTLRALRLLPWILLLAASNAFVEETITRFGVVAALIDRIGPNATYLASGALFGVAHYAGVPGGLAGVGPGRPCRSSRRRRRDPVRRWHEHESSCRFDEVPGAGHVVPLDAPEAFAASLADWIDEVEALRRSIPS